MVPQLIKKSKTFTPFAVIALEITTTRVWGGSQGSGIHRKSEAQRAGVSLGSDAGDGGGLKLVAEAR